MCLSILLALLDYAIANVALPDIALDLHTTASETIWVVNAYQLSSIVSLLPLAAVGAWIGYARLCVIGVILFMLSSVGCAMAPSLLVLTLARAVQGIGAACMLGVNTALIRFIYPKAELGRGITLNMLMVGLGLALGPSLAGIVLAFTTWPWLFWINIPFGALTLFLAQTSLPRPRMRSAMPDPVGALLCVIGLGALGLSGDGFAHGNNILSNLALLAAGTGATAMLVRHESALTQPILPVDLLRGNAFRIAFFTGLLGYIASNFFLVSLPFALNQHFGWSATATGLLMTSWAAGLILSTNVTKRLADRIPAGQMSSVGLMITAAGFVMFRMLPETPGAFDIAWRIAVAGFGFGVFQVPNNRAMMLSVPSGREGGASGMVQMARQGGQTLGAMAVAMTLRLVMTNGTMHCVEGGILFAVAAAMLSASRLLGTARPRPVS
ncbi:MFS transporter [Acetobacter oeni]|uniref:MFS transporter n=2 Tax=Acetobacter oeni TaxID=304077 RepID=A0A511XFW5_9PROT|nr:MFS transporter [Acetobacter oeni]